MTEPRALVEFISQHRKAQCAPDPKYPDGIDIDVSDGAKRTCAIKLPYPAPEVGTWAVCCEFCGYKALVTAAGRPDDPRSLRMPCQKREGLQ